MRCLQNFHLSVLDENDTLAKLTQLFSDHFSFLIVILSPNSNNTDVLTHFYLFLCINIHTIFD